ncbi:MAG: D-inositol-3-phosphate glycosyltransferase [Ignavibacteriaceae bacterium]|nr:D-inositol-3-phosphate glycosyltransferase [Ignavibacteriaceae bacterium]
MHAAPWLLGLATLLVQSRQVEIDIVSPISGLRRRESFEFMTGLRLHYIPTPRTAIDILTYNRIRIQTVRNFLVDSRLMNRLIHIHGTEHQYFSSVASLDVKCIITIQGIMKDCLQHLKSKNMFFESKVTFYKKLAEWSIAANYESKEIVKNLYFTTRTHYDQNYVEVLNPRSKISQIWEVIRSDFFMSKIQLSKKNILFVGGTHPLKGIDRALRIFSELKKNRKYNSLKLLVAGSVNHMIFNRLIKEMGISNLDTQDIEFLGYLDTAGMLKAFERSFCLLHPSYIDNSPNTICEAQSYGLPVIASNVGGVASLMTNRIDGLLVDESTNGFLSAIIELLDDDALINLLRTNSSHTAKKRHDPTEIKDKFLDIYYEFN